MRDPEGVAFLQWCLPRMGLRWRGFRRVRRIVYPRIERRLRELGLPDAGAYRAYLEGHPDEWAVLDGFCRVPLSRFYRDRAVFQGLEQVILPDLAAAAVERGRSELRAWSIGCAAGEEPYTLAIVWRLAVQPRSPGVRLSILATDIDREMIDRAGRASYPPYCLRDLPPAMLAEAFDPSPEGFVLREAYRSGVEFREQDVRKTAPEGCFDLILCRNVAFTYFEDAQQRRTLRQIIDRLAIGGVLVVGATESLPSGVAGLETWSRPLRIYRRAASAAQLGPHPDVVEDLLPADDTEQAVVRDDRQLGDVRVVHDLQRAQ